MQLEPGDDEAVFPDAENARVPLIRRPEPYTTFAGLYDLFSLEWPVYRSGRVAAIAALGLRAGDRVLDLGCGTGLNLRHLQGRIGPTGQVIAVDAARRCSARRPAGRGGTGGRTSRSCVPTPPR